MEQKCELPDESYYVSDIQDYFVSIIKKPIAVADNPLIRIYINKIENRISFKIKTGYFFELLTPQTIKLLGSAKGEITKNENG